MTNSIGSFEKLASSCNIDDVCFILENHANLGRVIGGKVFLILFEHLERKHLSQPCS